MDVTADPKALPTVLCIGGFDPSGGAGIIVDVQTITAFGCKPVAAITSLTFQNSHELFGAIHESGESLRAQILPILSEHTIAAVKIGMMPTAEIVFEVAGLIAEVRLPAPVVDPVIQSSSGYELMERDAVAVLLQELVPAARLLTPNIPEAERLTGMRIENEDGMRAAADKLREMGARAVLIKGGHLGKQRSEIAGQKSERGPSPTMSEGSVQAIDLLDEEGEVAILRGDWIDAPPVRGTGCMLSSAIAANLAGGASLSEAVAAAKTFVAAAIQNSKFKTQN